MSFLAILLFGSHAYAYLCRSCDHSSSWLSMGIQFHESNRGSKLEHDYRWLVDGLAPFGNNTGGYSSDPSGYFDYKTYWAADGSDGDDLWVRRAIDLSAYDLASLTWNLGVDNGYKLYANVSLVAQANEEGYTWRWEYSGNFSAIPLIRVSM